MRQGHVEVCSGIDRFAAHGVRFTDGSEKAFDLVILATGYRARIDSFLENIRIFAGNSDFQTSQDGAQTLGASPPKSDQKRSIPSTSVLYTGPFRFSFDFSFIFTYDQPFPGDPAQPVYLRAE